MPETNLDSSITEVESTTNPVACPQMNYPSSHLLLGAKDALEHLNGLNMDKDIMNFLSQHIVSNLSIMAGFNQELIQTGVGYLQEIHIFVSANIGENDQSHILQGLTLHCSPFPFVVFTPSGCLS
ncbi:MAG TPA: hypothetical protein VGO47_14400, partial [Chlamydiales bacterium]|nr:hypothetical protein [Chlamydiales bacterium]